MLKKKIVQWEFLSEFIVARTNVTISLYIFFLGFIFCWCFFFFAVLINVDYLNDPPIEAYSNKQIIKIIPLNPNVMDRSTSMCIVNCCTRNTQRSGRRIMLFFVRLLPSIRYTLFFVFCRAPHMPSLRLVVRRWLLLLHALFVYCPNKQLNYTSIYTIWVYHISI